jgi:hypothetical protein
LLAKLAEELKRNAEIIDAGTNAISTEHGLLRWQADFDGFRDRPKNKWDASRL